MPRLVCYGMVGTRIVRLQWSRYLVDGCQRQRTSIHHRWTSPGAGGHRFTFQSNPWKTIRTQRHPHRQSGFPPALCYAMAGHSSVRLFPTYELNWRRPKRGTVPPQSSPASHGSPVGRRRLLNCLSLSSCPVLSSRIRPSRGRISQRDSPARTPVPDRAVPLERNLPKGPCHTYPGSLTSSSGI